MLRPLRKEFYLRDPAEVARELLGKVIVRSVGGATLKCAIVETEAYYGPEDPASKARYSGDLSRTMWGEVGHALIYGIHRQWLLNVVAHEAGGVGAVLIRACEPLEGIELMMKFRGVGEVTKLTNGPGKLTKALKIDKSFHRKPLYTRRFGLYIAEGREVGEEEVVRDWRVGVSADLEIPLRFYVAGNPFVSRRAGASR